MENQEKQQSEQELIIAAQTGSQPALAELVQRYLAAVYGLSLRYLHNSEDAEDTTQDVFVKVWKNLHKFDRDKNFKAWILAIAKNTCLDALKKKQVIPFSAFDTDDGGNSLTETLAATGPLPFDFAHQSSLKGLAAVAIKKLSPAYRKVLSLYYRDGLNFREIAEQTEQPLHTVKSRHRRAILMLKRLLDQT